MSEKFREYKRKLRWKSGMRKLGAEEEVGVDKWAPYYALRNPQACDRYAREVLGIELHAGSTPEEIQRVVNMYKASW